MAKINYLLQGISINSHLQLIEEILSVPNIKRVVFSVAFMKSRGLLLLGEKLKPFYRITDVYIGIRNGVTSIQAIMDLIKNGVHPYLVDTGTSSFIFHPKIFLTYSDAEAKVIIGSANATSGGFIDNIEASTLLHLDRSIKEDEELLNKILNSLKTLVNDYPDNVIKVSTIKETVKIFQEGRLFDERVSPSPSSSLKSTAKNPEGVPRMKLKVRKRSVSAVMRKPKRKKVVAPTSKTQEWVLLWESGPLKESHLNIPSGSTTNNKGGMSFTKGHMEMAPGEHMHYFRDVVFNDLNWKLGTVPRYPHIERAYANFEIIIKGISYGVYKLELSHNTKTNTRSYEQGNYMTDIKWGDAMKVIARKDLLDHVVRLYKPSDSSTYFIMEIE